MQILSFVASYALGWMFVRAIQVVRLVLRDRMSLALLLVFALLAWMQALHGAKRHEARSLSDAIEQVHAATGADAGYALPQVQRCAR
ncbi:MAG TPA: hypothetical protein VFX59_10675 [Polyangiales bacterium]|nr:hypothetical protein [Polyangiales bacterium]